MPAKSFRSGARPKRNWPKIGVPPPYWAFAWAGGQALARYVLDHPACVTGKAVLDFGPGSGLVALAAAKAGAGHVSAADIDPFAIAAIARNAQANGVNIKTIADDVIGTRIGSISFWWATCVTSGPWRNV